MAPYRRRRRVEVLRDPFPPGPPVPTAGCSECAMLMRQWQQVKNPRNPTYNPSRASDLVVLIRRHPHGQIQEG